MHVHKHLKDKTNYISSIMYNQMSKVAKVKHQLLPFTSVYIISEAEWDGITTLHVN